MANPSASPQEHHVTPTGTVIHEPTFPDLPGSPPDPENGTTLDMTANDDGTPANMSQQNVSSPPREPETRHEPMARPAQPRSATERPKASTKHSLLGRLQGSPRKANQPDTVVFDPYTSRSESSDSSDSSDDERHMPRQSLSHNNDLARQETRERRKSKGGPFSRIKVANEHFKGNASISRSDGRVKLNLLDKDVAGGQLAKALGAVLNKHHKNEDNSDDGYDRRDIRAAKIAPEDDEMEHDSTRRVKLNIVIIIIGSRGDIQPFIRIGKILQNDYGHRVRMATHPAFKDFVEKDSGLEFFSIGGNPAELMAFMVKNPGLVPNLETIKEGEIGKRRAQMYEMFCGMWRACINATDDETDKMNVKMSK